MNTICKTLIFTSFALPAAAFAAVHEVEFETMDHAGRSAVYSVTANPDGPTQGVIYQQGEVFGFAPAGQVTETSSRVTLNQDQKMVAYYIVRPAGPKPGFDSAYSAVMKQLRVPVYLGQIDELEIDVLQDNQP